jgi:hypothetical protein
MPWSAPSRLAALRSRTRQADRQQARRRILGARCPIRRPLRSGQIAGSAALANARLARPISTPLDGTFGDPRGAREAGEILQKMLALGLSRFEPNPLQAIAEAEFKACFEVGA